MNLPTLSIKTAQHNNLKVVQLHFEKNENLLQLLRNNKSLRWSQTMKCWYISFSKDIKQEIFKLVRGSAFLDYSAFEQEAILEKINASHPSSTLKTSGFSAYISLTQAGRLGSVALILGSG